MTRNAVEKQFHLFIKELSTNAIQEFRPTHIITSSYNTGGLNIISIGEETLKTVLNTPIKTEINEIQQSLERQFDLVLEYLESRKQNKIKRKFIKKDFFYKNLQSNRKKLKSNLEYRLNRMAEDVEPLVKSNKEDFWMALYENYSEKDSRKFIKRHFSFSDTIDKYKNDLNLTTRINIGLIDKKIEYTDEAIRVIKKSEKDLRNKLDKKIDNIY